MLSLENLNPSIAQMEVAKSVWHRLKSHLENEKARVYGAIMNYPTPIAGCDQQFNYLLEEQTRIRLELDRLSSTSHDSIPAEDSFKRIDEFMASSSYFDLETAQIIQAYLEEGISQAPPN